MDKLEKYLCGHPSYSELPKLYNISNGKENIMYM